MSEECTHDCSTCGKNCGDRKEKFDFSAKLNAASKVGKVIAVASGKGGVGKSFVTTMLAVAAAKRGLKVGILDADVTGPSIPKAFGLAGSTYKSDDGIEPTMTNTGIKVISLNMLVEDPSDPVVWRGPVIAGLVKQFWTDVHWGELDVMFVDMPPGTGDVPLTVFQSLPVDGVVVVSSPQELVEMIVSKSVKMAKMMEKPVVGLVENMSYLKCPDCGREIAYPRSRAAPGRPVVCRVDRRRRGRAYRASCIRGVCREDRLMLWIGPLAGAILCSRGGLLGAFLGSLLGGWIERRIREERWRARGERRSPRQRANPLADAYRTLGVKPGASKSAVRRAYHALAKKYHPDILRASGASEREVSEATEKMSRVNAAWNIIENQ